MTAELAHNERERYRVHYVTGAQERVLSMFAARGLLLRGIALGLFVEAWEEPWPCRIDSNGDIRARCPGANSEPYVVGVDLRALSAANGAG